MYMKGASVVIGMGRVCLEDYHLERIASAGYDGSKDLLVSQI
jgi:hypothetical protein